MALFLLPLFVTYLGFDTFLNSAILGIAAVFVAVSAPVGGYLMDKYRSRLEWPFCAGILFGVFAVLGFFFCELEANLVFLFAAVVRVFSSFWRFRAPFSHASGSSCYACIVVWLAHAVIRCR